MESSAICREGKLQIGEKLKIARARVNAVNSTSLYNSSASRQGYTMLIQGAPPNIKFYFIICDLVKEETGLGITGVHFTLQLAGPNPILSPGIPSQLDHACILQLINSLLEIISVMKNGDNVNNLELKIIMKVMY